MAKLVFGMNQSLDGYVDHMAFAPSPTLFRHFIDEAQGQVGSVYGRQMYEGMRYWDDDHPEWDAEEHAFVAAWRNQPKWVVSRSLKSVGPNARLVQEDLEGAIRKLKTERDGEIEIAGPDLARSVTELGLIDEYRIYLHPVVLGHGKPYFAGPRPPLRLMTNDRIGEDVIRLTYVPASSRDPPDGNRRLSLLSTSLSCHQLNEFLSTENGKYLVQCFRKTYPYVDVTEIKMLDLVLWQTRPNRSVNPTADKTGSGLR